MARILYGVSGEGSGHATRSKEILCRLARKHKIKVLAYGKSYDFLKDSFDVQKIYGLHLYYRDGGGDYLKTVLSNLRRLPTELGPTTHAVHDLVRVFKPDLVISDFEPASGIVAARHRLPLISLDNQHIFTNCDVKYPKRFAKEALLNKLVIAAYLPHVSETLITCFYHPKIKKPNTYLFPPILREKILRQRPSKDDHILVYQTASGDDSIVKTLKDSGLKFVFYGCNKDLRDGNVLHKKFSEDGFIRDLATCRFVIANGGLSLLCEALHLGKPVLSVPIAGQFEQIANAYYLDKLGYGKYYGKLTAARIKSFEKNLPQYADNLKDYPRADCSAIIERLEELIEKYAKVGRKRSTPVSAK